MRLPEPNVSEQELILLSIAAQGGYLAPVGEWKEAILRLTSIGYLRKQDDVNYVITRAGRKVHDAQEDADARAFIALNNLEVERRNAGRVLVECEPDGVRPGNR